ncbi:hypothetical protein BGZ67_002254 [Mortierella alpina]|nr:hypothetical protein BGZ67_002254 [Mortierella alpina]
MSSDFASDGTMSPPPDSAPPHEDLSRPNLTWAMAANWLSMIGSLMIMLHVPRVIEQVPTQRKRMLIIFFTALSNFGFSFANIMTDFTGANTFLPCSVSAWCYVFFQLLTCMLVIVSTFRLCGVFLFERRRSIPSKYIALCPLGAFILATVPAIAQQFGFDECAHYCWFVVKHYEDNCQERSLWAYLCFYAWMILFLLILFGSTLYVMVRIAISFMHVRSRVKQVVNQTIKPASGAEPPPSPQMSAFERVRSLSYRVKDKTTSIFSSDSRRQQGSSWSQQDRSGEPVASAAYAVNQNRGQQGIGSSSSPSPSATRSENAHTFHGHSPQAPRNESILSSSYRDEDASSRAASNTTSTRGPGAAQNPVASENNIIRINERTLLIAILRQALYPISISVSGCIQIIVDLTVMTRVDYLETLDYLANIATSIQGFLFFLVFMFDPAVVYTRRQWRKYLVWKYYIEFYYSLGMPQEGREFHDQFLQQCQHTMIRSGSSKDEANYDVFLKQPSYSWSLHDDNLAMPSEFQTAYPLIHVGTPADADAPHQQEEGLPDPSGSSFANVSPRPERKKTSLSRAGGTGEKLPDKFYGHGHYGTGATRTDYTPSVSDPSSKSVTSPIHSCAEEEGRCHPMSNLAVTSSHGNDSSDQSNPHIAFNHSVNAFENHGASNSNEGQARATGQDTGQSVHTANEYQIHPNGFRTANRPTASSHHYNHSQQGEGRVLHLPRVDRHRHPRDVLGGEVSPCSSHSDTGSGGDYSYSGTDGEGGDTDGANGGNHHRHHRRRRASVVAANPGDVLSFPQLAKVATIGGTLGPPSLQHYRTSTHTATTGTTRPSKSSSAGRATFLSATDRSNSMRPSLKERFKIPGIRNIRGIRRRDSVLDIERYQTKFEYPRCAYLLHMVVRWLWVPREVRLPPIPNPQRRADTSHPASALEAYDSEAVLTVMEAMEMSQNEPYRDSAMYTNGSGTMTPLHREDDEEVGEGIGLSRLRNEWKLGERVIPMPPLADGDDYTASRRRPIVMGLPQLLRQLMRDAPVVTKLLRPKLQKWQRQMRGYGLCASWQLHSQQGVATMPTRMYFGGFEALGWSERTCIAHVSHLPLVQSTGALPCHYDLSQVETCAPFLDRYGGVVFVYDWNVAKDTITQYYRSQYPDGWVKVAPFSLRNILDAIKNLDHRLDRYDHQDSRDDLTTSDHSTSHNRLLENVNGSNGSIHSTSSTRSNTSNSSSGSNGNLSSEAKKQHKVVFLLTGSMNPDYGVFGLTQKMILTAVKDAMPERIQAVNIIGHCMYGCASCSGVEHKVPLYFTRYFNKTLPYTAQDVRRLYASPKTDSAANGAHAVLVAPSCGSTSMIAQKPLIQLFHRLEQTGRWKFIWKMHPTSLHLDGYDTEDASGVEQVELENVKFILAHFTVTIEEHACLLPFMEAFDIVITDLHSSVPFIATYFTPKVILSYFNDADYGTPERHQEFMDQLNTFIEPEELEALLNNLPAAKGDPSFFHSQYGHVDGHEDLKFGNLAKWPTEQFEPTQAFQYRQAMAHLALEWKKIWKSMVETYADDVEGANNALGFDGKFPLLQGEDTLTLPRTLPRVLPRERRAAGIELRIMSFNIWNGGLASGMPLEQTAKAILASGADIVGLQECSSMMEASGERRYMLPELMQHLPGWYYSDQKLRSVSTGPRNPWGIVSKFPIVNTTELGFGVKIQLNNHRHPEMEPSYYRALSDDQYAAMSARASHSPSSPTSPMSMMANGGQFLYRAAPNTRFMYLFNCHLYYFPYQPFQLLKIPYDNQPFLSTAEEAVQSCIEARGKEMEAVLNEIRQVADQEQDVPIFLTGDFNEPSHLDWTPLSAMTGLQPLQVAWPMTEWAYKAGLVDLWRAYRPHMPGSGSSPTSPLSGHVGSFGSSLSHLTAAHPNAKSNSPQCAMSPKHGEEEAAVRNEVDKAEQQVIERPGFTWTALRRELDGMDHYDRIDFIFGLDRESSPIALKEVAIKMGEELCRSGEKNEKVFKPWPSDHRAVIATVLL